MIETSALNFSYNEDHRFQFPDIQVPKAGSLLIIGKSGIGKTTLLHLLAGLLPPTSGQVMVAGQSLFELKGSRLDKFRGQHIGVVFQRSHFVRSLTILENLLLIQRLSGEKVDPKRGHEVLDTLGLRGLERKYPHKLSQGQQQRATIAMATINLPAVLLADEPTSSLDDENCARVIGLLKHHSETLGAALIVITHDHRLQNQLGKTLAL